MGPEQWKGAVSSGLPVLCCPSLPFTRRLAGRLFVFSRMDPSLVWVLTCACLGAIVFLHCKGVVWEFASQPHVKSTRTMPDRPKNERDIVKPTVNICAAVIFFVWACPQRVPPFSCLECGARIGGLQALRHWGLPRRKGPRCLQVMPAGHDHIRLWTLGLFAYRTQGLHTEGS